MKKTLLFLFSIIFSFAFLSEVKAQDPQYSYYGVVSGSNDAAVFEKGNHFVAVGYGFYGLANKLNDAGGLWKNNWGPVYAKYETAISNTLGIGLNTALTSAQRSVDQVYKDKTSVFTVGALLNYHLHELLDVDKLDAYIGAGAGMKYHSLYVDKTSPFFVNDLPTSNIKFTPMVRVGARYFLIKNVGLYLEIGYDNTADADMGVIVKF